MICLLSETTVPIPSALCKLIYSFLLEVSKNVLIQQNPTKTNLQWIFPLESVQFYLPLYHLMLSLRHSNLRVVFYCIEIHLYRNTIQQHNYNLDISFLHYFAKKHVIFVKYAFGEVSRAVFNKISSQITRVRRRIDII